MNLVDPILFQARRQPPSAAICVPGPGIGLISYWRLETLIHNIGRRLHAAGLRPQAVVGVSVADVILHVAIVLALTRLGAITLSLRDDGHVVPIDVDALITTSAAPWQTSGRVIMADMSWTEGDGEPLPPHMLPRVRDDDLCRIILTSGTTNRPKAVALSHKLLAARINRHLSVFGNRLGSCSRIYCDVPVSSSLGFQFLLYTLWRGGTIVFPGPDFQQTLQAFEAYQVQCIVGSPGAFETLLRWFETVPHYQSSVEAMLCGGDILSRSLSERLRARICSHLIAAYGSTEASMSATAHAHEIAALPRSVGFLTPGVDIQVVDGNDTVLSPGREGFVRIRSEFAVNEYFRNPEESAKIFRGGWFYPGDIGTLGSEGLLTILGREQAVLNLGGDKINPERIELAISQFKGVVEAAAFTAPNEYGNNEVHAAVVCGPGVSEQALREHCGAVIPLGFAPVKFHFVESLPHNEMGKVDRRRVQGQFGVP